MQAESVIAIAYERGLRPSVVRDVLGNEAVEWQGGKPTPNMKKVLALHEARVLELVKAEYRPPLVGGDAPVPVADPTVPDRPKVPFDAAAEAVVVGLYALNAGLVPTAKKCPQTGSALFTFAVAVGPPGKRVAVERLLADAKPLRDRVMAHVAPAPFGVCTHPDYKSAGHWFVEWRIAGYPDGHHLAVLLKDYEVATVAHPFLMRPPSQATAWRMHGTTGWRAIWGRWEPDENGWHAFVPWGQ